MAKHVIEAFDSDAEFVTYRRDDIERFVRAARRTEERLREELHDAEARVAKAEAALAERDSRAVFKLPHWTERRESRDDTAFFESLREPFDVA